MAGEKKLDFEIENTLTQMEKLEVEERRRKALEHSFKEYFESPDGKKTLEDSEKRRKLLDKAPRKYKAPIIPNLNKDESLIKDLKV